MPSSTCIAYNIVRQKGLQTCLLKFTLWRTCLENFQPKAKTKQNKTKSLNVPTTKSTQKYT